MQNSYKYAGKSLTPKMARELVMEILEQKPDPIAYQKLREQVDELHLSRGGREYAGKTHHPVRPALTRLKREGAVKWLNLGQWQISSQPSSTEIESHPDINNDENDSSAPRTIGPGKREVYVYYYPKYQEAAQLKGESAFECKIGNTRDESKRRTHAQTSTTGMPEERKIGLIIKTDEPEKIERCIHGILKAVGRHIEDAPGTEWFRTNSDEVEGIFNSINRLIT